MSNELEELRKNWRPAPIRVGWEATAAAILAFLCVTPIIITIIAVLWRMAFAAVFT
jgi:hypothetical protein